MIHSMIFWEIPTFSSFGGRKSYTTFRHELEKRQVYAAMIQDSGLAEGPAAPANPAIFVCSQG